MKTKEKPGRPRVGRKRVVTVRVPEEVAQVFDAVAKRRRVWHTQVYQEAIIRAAEALAREDGAALAEAAGVKECRTP